MRLILAATVCFGLLFAQSPTGYYPFNIDQDSLLGAPDFSFLNQPLEAKDRLFVRGSHFHKVGPDLEPNTEDDERVRLYGVNLAFGANFPAEEDAPRIARRLRRLGVNLVRFHHMDSSPDSNPANANSILTNGPYPTFNDISIARLRAFLNALRSEGIYANINLHVGYVFRPTVDGVPELPAGAAFPSHSKPLHIIHPRLVELQNDFVRGLFQRLELAGDPVLGMAEISNETSVLYSYQNGTLDSVALGEYRDVLARRWNWFLAERYKSDEELRKAWAGGVEDGPDLLPQAWRPLEIHSGASAVLAQLDEGVVRVDVPTAAPSGAPIVILKKVGFSLSTDQSYVAEVEMRADVAAGASCSVYWDVKQDVSPWKTIMGRNITINSGWQRFRMAFTPSFAIDVVGRFGLSLEKCAALIYVRNARLFTGGERGYDPSETLAKSNFALVSAVDNSTQGRAADYADFLADTDRAYNHSLLFAIRETTDSLLPVTGTQMGFGGMMIFDAQLGMDYFDEHFYVDHYNFPNTAWDGRDWRFRDTSSIGSNWSAFLDVAAARIAGRPYTISEFNQPWPNTYASEINPTLSAFAGFQDWDALVHFAYEHSRSWDAGVPHGFNLNGDWSKFANFGQAALMFRLGTVAAARETVIVPAGPAVRRKFTRERRNGSFTPALAAYFDYQDVAAIRHRVELDPDREAEDPAAALPEGARLPADDVVESDTGEIVFDRRAQRVIVNAPKAAGIFGQTKGARLTAGPLTVELSENARGAANILLTSLDTSPIAESRRMLLSNPGHTLRTQPSSEPQRRQEIVLYKDQAGWYTVEPDTANKPSGNLNGGSAPVWMERVEAQVMLAIPAESIEVYPLDGSGQRMGAIAVEKTDGGFSFQLTAPTPWYEIVVLD